MLVNILPPKWMVSWLQKLIMESWEKKRFKTGVNSASPNANWPQESTMPREEPLKVTKRLGAEGDIS